MGGAEVSLKEDELACRLACAALNQLSSMLFHSHIDSSGHARARP